MATEAGTYKRAISLRPYAANLSDTTPARVDFIGAVFAYSFGGGKSANDNEYFTTDLSLLL